MIPSSSSSRKTQLHVTAGHHSFTAKVVEHRWSNQVAGVVELVACAVALDAVHVEASSWPKKKAV